MQGKNGPRLSALAVEWMMGLPDGHVTGVDISRNDQLKALGNGVVPQQAELALQWLLFGEWTGVTGDARMLSTPCASEVGGNRNLERRRAAGSHFELSDVVHLLPTPRASEPGATRVGYGRSVFEAVTGTPQLLPTPAVNDMGAGKTVEAWDEWTDRMKAEHGNGNGNGKSLAIEAQRLGGDTA